MFVSRKYADICSEQSPQNVNIIDNNINLTTNTKSKLMSAAPLLSHCPVTNAGEKIYMKKKAILTLLIHHVI